MMPQNKRRSPNTPEKCVVCGTETGYKSTTPIDKRYHYVEGAGQLCPRCYCNIYDETPLEPNVEITAYKLTIGQKFYRFLKSIMDFFIALLALIFLIPVFLVVAIAIKVDSEGPVFFVQKRIGKGGKLFNCVKFRSMSTDARHDIAGYEYKDASAYITKTGAFIRKFSIDELPQLFNVLTFKMSLIGYRPSQPSEKELNDAREAYNLYQTTPGISGWAQVNGRDILAARPKKKAEFDAYYLRHFSFGLDVKIFFMTIIKVFKSDDVLEGSIAELPSDDRDNPSPKNNDKSEKHQKEFV